MTSELLGELAEVKVLIPAGSSPHYYHLKPSDIRNLSQADLVIWVGPTLELFLQKPLSGLNRPTLQLLAVDEEEHSEEPGHDDHDDHEENGAHHHHHHDHGGGDNPHIWLDPILMIKAAQAITEQLKQQFPQHKTLLEQRYQVFEAALRAQDQQIAQQLKPYRERGFVVFHDAFEPMVEHYQLKQLAYFTVDPSRAPGAKKVARIQRLLKQQDAVCIFSEPQFESALVKRISEGLEIAKGELDPLAIEVRLEQGYTGFLQQLADNMEHCLK
jgi:zinc transport system substrate-binding protein